MLTHSEISKTQDRLKRECLSGFDQHLDNGRDFFLSLFPNATIRAVLDSGEKSASARPYINYRTDRIRSIVQSVLEASTSSDPLPELQGIDIQELQVPLNMSRILIQTLVRIIACERNLLEDDFIFLGEVGAALDFPPGEVHSIIDQIQYESRKAFFAGIRKNLNEDQQDLCAILLLKAIRADDSVHPAEFKYFENISQLLDFDQARLEHVGVSADTFDFTNAAVLPHDISIYIFEYLVEIVMCDRKYDPKESAFIQSTAEVFGFDKEKQDAIIQPVAAALMLKADLFQ